MSTWSVYLSGEIHTDWRERVGKAQRNRVCLLPFRHLSLTTLLATIVGSTSSAKRIKRFGRTTKGQGSTLFARERLSSAPMSSWSVLETSTNSGMQLLTRGTPALWGNRS